MSFKPPNLQGSEVTLLDDLEAAAREVADGGEYGNALAERLRAGARRLRSEIDYYGDLSSSVGEATQILARINGDRRDR